MEYNPRSRLSARSPIIQFNLEAAPKAPADMAPAVYQATFYKLSEKPWLTLHLADDKNPCLLKQLLLHLIGNHDMEWGINPRQRRW